MNNYVRNPHLTPLFLAHVLERLDVITQEQYFTFWAQYKMGL